MGVYARSFRYLKPVWPQSVLGLLFMLLATALSIIKPWPLKYLIDGVLTPAADPAVQASRDLVETWFGMAPSTQILGLCGVFVVVNLVLGVVSMAQHYVFLGAGLQVLLRLRTDLYMFLQALPLRFHDLHRSTDSAYRVAYDSQSIQTIYNKGFSGAASSLLLLLGTLAVMAWMNWQLTLAALFVLPFLLWSVRYYAGIIRRQSTEIHERESSLLGQVQEGLGAIRMVHAFGREHREVRQFRVRAGESLRANLRLNMTSVMSSMVVGLIIAGGTALLYYIGSRQVLEGNLTIGDLTVFLAYLVMLYQPLEQITYTAWALEGAAAGMQRCFEILDSENDVEDQPGARMLETCQGHLSFQSVHFDYGRDRRVLQGIDLEVKPGEILALVGGTGAGKSTLLGLIPRFYDPNEGRVLLDGVDLRELTKKSLRSRISLVLQDTLLFSTTVRENIAYSRPGASEAEIEEAAKKAQAWDFLSALPDGLASQVGERGAQLSVGQRQRIGIARAFLKNSPILLLDEPTSALDPATERAIMDALLDLMKGRTTVMVTHRLAAVHHLARIAVLQEGKIVECGSGPELLERGGVYASLYRASNER
jgi:ATP-binding cassette subfamily B protein